jgi:hypothetical protein
MNTAQRCPECGAVWIDGVTCQDHFYQMLYWETENPMSIAQVHHLAVLCYHLQHPGLYSPEGLKEAQRLLDDFLERGASPQQVRRRNRDALDSGNRTFKIKGRAGLRGRYVHPVQWAMTAADVTAGGVNRYGDKVNAWARSILEALKASGNLTPE